MGTFNIEAVLSNKRESPDFELKLPEGRGPHYMFILFLSDCMFSYEGENYFYSKKQTAILYPPSSFTCYRAVNGEFNNSFISFDADKKLIGEYRFPLARLIRIGGEESKIIDEYVDRISFLKNTCYDLSHLEEIDISMRKILKIIEDCYENKKLQSDELGESNLSYRLNEIRAELYRAPENLTIKKMADSLSYSATWFGILYKRKFGVTPVKDREKAIVKRIEFFLTNTDYTLGQIAERLNIQSESYLIRLFKKQRGGGV